MLISLLLTAASYTGSSAQLQTIARMWKEQDAEGRDLVDVMEA
jgi:hypothetical protein